LTSKNRKAGMNEDGGKSNENHNRSELNAEENPNDSKKQQL
jgi:hypothetical protein